MSSSATVYEICDRQLVWEDFSGAPISPCGLYKHIAEQFCSGHGACCGEPCTLVCFFHMEEGCASNFCGTHASKAQTGDFAFFGIGGEPRDWLRMEDAVRLLRVAMYRSASHYPVTSGAIGQSVRIQEILSR